MLKVLKYQEKLYFQKETMDAITTTTLKTIDVDVL